MFKIFRIQVPDDGGSSELSGISVHISVLMHPDSGQVSGTFHSPPIPHAT